MLLVDSSGLLFQSLLSDQKTAVADGQQLPLVQEKIPLVVD